MMKSHSSTPTLSLREKEMNKIVAENKQFIDDKPFFLDIEILDMCIGAIHKTTDGSHKQISAMVMLDIAYILAYSGLHGTDHYLFDASPSGTAKDSTSDRSYELLLKPVMKIQNERKKAYEYKCQNSDEDLPIKAFPCIHINDATPQGTFRGFDTTKSQYIRIGEISNKLRSKDNSLMNFITNGYGKHTLIHPNYKKDLDTRGDLAVEDISLFFYGNSNIQMMGRSTFMHHLQGGLLNRCVMVYNTHKRAFEYRPERYDFPLGYIELMNEYALNLMTFSQKYSDETKPTIPRTEAYVAFDKYIYDQINEMSNTAVQDLFKRTMQNLNAYILTLHYLVCAQDEEWYTEVSESTVLMGVEFMQYIIEDYDTLIDEIIGAAQDVRDESNTQKIRAKVKELSSAGKSKVSHRELYRALHLNRKDYDALIADMHYKKDKSFLYFLSMTS